MGKFNVDPSRVIVHFKGMSGAESLHYGFDIEQVTVNQLLLRGKNRLILFASLTGGLWK